MKNLIIIAILTFNWINILAQRIDLGSNDFGINSSIHVKKLCGFGERLPNSEAEKNTIHYVASQFRISDMDVKMDTIMYCSYELQYRSIIINGKQTQIKTALINCPIKDTIQIEAHWIKLKNEIINKEEIKDKIVFTSSSKSAILLNNFKPAAVIVIDTSTFEALTIKETKKVKITFVGHLKSNWIKSYNVIATYKQKGIVDSSIIITAHWDSNNGVGAGDNASGTAVLIELSKFFKTRLTALKYNLIFIATGSEEPGLVGSTSYIFNNKQQIDKCVLNLNIDCVSDSLPYIETTNIGQNIERMDTSQTLTIISDRFFKRYLLSSFWEIYNNRYTDLNAIKRLRYKFEQSMNELGYDFQDASCCSGVDSRAFNYVGIPYIQMGSINPNSNEDNANTSKDIYNDNFIENIIRNGKIACNIIMNFNK